MENKKVIRQKYRGIVYQRYPESISSGVRCYYQAKKNNQIMFLHREVYKHEIGEIPEGYVIHHIDGDTDNNSEDNLKCMSNADHARLHANEPEQRELHRKRGKKTLDRQWADPLFRKIHSERLKRQNEERRNNARIESKVCVECGQPFEAKIGSGGYPQKYCSSKCRISVTRRNYNKKRREKRHDKKQNK